MYAENYQLNLFSDVDNDHIICLKAFFTWRHGETQKSLISLSMLKSIYILDHINLDVSI